MSRLQRREVLRGGAALVATGLTPSYGAGVRRFPVVVDVSEDTTSYVSQFAAKGVKVVCRYYALDKQPGLPTKILTKNERDAIYSAGISIGIAYQYHNNDLASFTSARGKADALKALEYGSQVIGQPKGSTIFFGVDNDWPYEAEWRNVMLYFESISREFKNSGDLYNVGVYGSGLSCIKLGSARLASRFWLAKSIGYTGTKSFYNSGQWHLYQNSLETKIGRLSLDTNWVNWRSPKGVGFFNESGLSDVVSETDILEQRRFVTHRTALRHEPRLKSSIVGTIGPAENVLIVRSDGEFTRVIVNEDESRQAYCPTALLSPVRSMP